MHFDVLERVGGRRKKNIRCFGVATGWCTTSWMPRYLQKVPKKGVYGNYAARGARINKVSHELLRSVVVVVMAKRSSVCYDER